MTSIEETIEQFCANLSSTLCSVPDNDKLTLLGDFNPCIGCDHSLWEGLLGKHGIVKMNSNILLLLSKCAECEPLIMNVVFRMTVKYKATLMHPRFR